MTSLTIGEPVEFRMVDRDEGEKWLPATIIAVDDFQICMQGADNIRRAIPRRSADWRRA